MNIYQQEILDKYNNPQHFGKPENYTKASKSTNLSCGDEIEIFLELEGDIIKDLHFEGEGCIISMATAEILCETFTGKHKDEILKLSWEDILGIIGINLTTSRIKCANLSLEAIQKGLSETGI